MKRLSGHIPAMLALVVLITGLLVLSGCSASKSTGEGFAIYLTRDDIPPSQMEALSHVEIADQPVLTLNDIVAYDAGTHKMELAADAFERIASLEVPVRGKSFLVCVDRQPIYWGAFWTPLSSLSFDGVTIWKPFGSQDSRVIGIGVGYPSSSFYGGEDPRDSTDVMESLEKAGKLAIIPADAALDSLPRSMKGYELYSWQEDGQWHFTLITGTNRTKTMAEITSRQDSITEDGWVKLHVVGEDAIKDVLGRLPQGEFVSWCDELHIGQTGQADISLQLPPSQIVDTIEEHAEGCGLDLFAARTP